MSDSGAPLADVHVVDLTALLPGPWCSLMLWRLGADVTWVQRPGGDPLRALDPGPYACLARGKRIVELDLKDVAARATFDTLIDGADVVVEGFRPAVAARLGVDAASLEVPIAAAALKLAETRIAAAADAERPSKAELMARGGYGVFACADGGWLAIGCIEDRFWTNLVKALGAEHLLDDERLGSYRERCRHAHEVNAAIAQAIARRPLADWVERLTSADVPATAVTSPWELAREPQVRHWGLLGERGVGLPYTGLAVRDAA